MKTILGLDLGTNSVGWAVINSVIKEQAERIWIETAGAGLFRWMLLYWEISTKGILYRKHLKGHDSEGLAGCANVNCYVVNDYIKC